MGDVCEDFPFFFDDDFVRENLSFLMEDDFFEPNLGTSLHYRSYEEENSIYNTAKINTNVLTSWSSSSSGSISSIREQTSQYVNICLRLEMKNQFQCSSHTGFSLPDSGFLETSNLHDNSFLLDFPTDLTSTPTKRGRNEYVERVQVLGDKDNQSQVENATGLTTVQNDTSVQHDPWNRPPSFDLLCKFCLKNGEPAHVYSSHPLKTRDGLTTCPILRRYVCEVCGETGDRAHTRKYCPFYNENARRKPSSRILSNGTTTWISDHK